MAKKHDSVTTDMTVDVLGITAHLPHSGLPPKIRLLVAGCSSAGFIAYKL